MPRFPVRFRSDIAALLMAGTLPWLPLAAQEAQEADDAEARAGAVAQVVQAESQYVSELVALKRYDLASEHLDVIRRLAPTERALIRRHEGDLHLAQEHWLEALDRYSGIDETTVSPETWLQIQRGRLTAARALGRHDTALAILDELPADDKRPDWASTADHELGLHLLTQATETDDTQLSRAKRDAGMVLLMRYARTLPEATQPGWVRLQEASVLHDALLRDAARMSNADTALDIPDPLRPTALRIRGLYRRIALRHPDTESAAIALDRVDLIERMLRGELLRDDDMTDADTPTD